MATLIQHDRIRSILREEWKLAFFLIVMFSHTSQGSHTDWKTWKNGTTFSSQGKVRELLCRLEKSGKIGQNTGKVRGNLGNFYFFVLFLIELYLLKWIKFSVFRPTWWVSSVVIQFGESWCPTACTCSPSTDGYTGFTVNLLYYLGLDGHERTILKVEGAHKALIYIP